MIMRKLFFKELGKRFFVYVAILACGALFGGIYGALNDQITYTISPEYYTKFKFEQFGIKGSFATEYPRLGAAIVGVFATWWAGLLLAAILGLFAFMQQSCQQMFKCFLRSAGIVVFAVAAATFLAWCGFIFTGVYVPKYINDKDAFKTVGNMHNIAYIAGVVGLILGVLYNVAYRIFCDTKTLCVQKNSPEIRG